MIQDDESNPWRWIGTAIVGQPCEVVVKDRFGFIHVQDHVFKHDDGDWYLIKAERRLPLAPMAWRYAMIAKD